MTLTIVTKCQVKSCKSEKASPRRYYAKDYVGPCGDSFCYASCDMSSCHEQSAILCNKHYNALRKKT